MLGELKCVIEQSDVEAYLAMEMTVQRKESYGKSNRFNLVNNIYF